MNKLDELDDLQKLKIQLDKTLKKSQDDMNNLLKIRKNVEAHTFKKCYADQKFELKVLTEMKNTLDQIDITFPEKIIVLSAEQFKEITSKKSLADIL